MNHQISERMNRVARGWRLIASNHLSASAAAEYLENEAKDIKKLENCAAITEVDLAQKETIHQLNSKIVNLRQHIQHLTSQTPE